MHNCDFTYEHYKGILKLIKDLEYKTVLFSEANSYDKEVILRHDLDVDLKKALKMAEIENEFDMSTTYFVWMSSPFYNIFEKNNTQIINKIIGLGHKIGLHFDVKSYDIINEIQLEDYIRNEIQIIEKFFNLKIDTISFHMPPTFLLNNNFDLGGLINTYHNKFFQGYKYISDSEMRWRDGCACKLLKSDKYSKIQILTHPIWWNADSLSSNEIMNGFYNGKEEVLKENWNMEIKVK